MFALRRLSRVIALALSPVLRRTPVVSLTTRMRPPPGIPAAFFMNFCMSLNCVRSWFTSLIGRPALGISALAKSPSGSACTVR